MTRPRWRTLVIGALVVTLAGAGVLYVRDRIRPCAGPFETAGLLADLSEPGVWFAVRSPVEVEPVERGTVLVATLEMVGGDEELVDLDDGERRFPASRALAEDVAELVEGGSEVFVKVDGARELVALVVVAPDGAASFLGGCEAARANRQLEDLHGDGSDAVVRRLVGAGGRASAAILGTDHPHPLALDPERSDPGLMDGLEAGRLRLAAPLPASWVGPYTVCARIAMGWSECIPLEESTPSPESVVSYHDPDQPIVEVWLVGDDGDVGAPIARLGRIDLAVAATERSGAEELRVTVTLPDGVAVTEVGPDVEPPGVVITAEVA